MPARTKTKSTGRSGLDGAIRGVCDIFRRSSCTGAMKYVPERLG